VIQGRARFRFRNIATGESHAIDVSGDAPTVVDTVPGWAHDITNTGSDPLLVLLWANENFDRQRPDTIAAPLP
jgi:UDP-2-acetamido-2,6-beta-L-arabino-hexul-4-ose reductase